jgi:hypothetical protein
MERLFYSTAGGKVQEPPTVQVPTGGFIERCQRPETPPGDQQVEKLIRTDPYPPPFFLSPKSVEKRRFLGLQRTSFEFRCRGKPRKSACRHFPFSCFNYFLSASYRVSFDAGAVHTFLFVSFFFTKNFHVGNRRRRGKFDMLRFLLRVCFFFIHSPL